MTDALAEFVAELSIAQTLDEMEASFSKALRRIGVEFYTYHIVRTPSSAGRQPYIISSYPKQWIQHYFSKAYLDDDPVVSEALQRQLPFTWHSIVKPEDLSRRQRKLMDEARDAGVNNGMTIPLIGRGVGVAAASLVGPASPMEAERFFHSYNHLLHLMALYFHAKAGSALLESSLTAASPRRHSLLTPREREVLKWVGCGKSNWEIAAILNISHKSIEFHLEGAKRKLQVFNRTHAVVKAITMGLISIP